MASALITRAQRMQIRVPSAGEVLLVGIKDIIFERHGSLFFHPMKPRD